MKTRVFTVEEAEALLPVLSPLLQKLQKEKNKANLCEFELKLASTLTEEKIMFSKEFNPSKRISEMDEIVRKINVLDARIHSYGCHLKDIELGLVDFLSEIDGRPVYLCWRLGEPEITYYHEINEGFQKRKYIWFG